LIIFYYLFLLMFVYYTLYVLFVSTYANE